MTSSINDSLLLPTATVHDAVSTLERCWIKVVLVVDEDQHLLGSITDGDIRRALLRGVSLSDPVSTVMNSKPKFARMSDDREPIIEMMRRNILRHMPIVDDAGRVVAIETLQELSDYHWRDNWVVLLAGGMGQRLRPLTEDCPKPMLPVGDRPILQILIERLQHFGFRKFFVSINYLGHMIQEYFGDGRKFGVDIRYLTESKRLGTAGALSLLPGTPEQPVLVVNGDILTTLDFGGLMDFHVEQGNDATMCVRDYVVMVPFGVVDVQDHRITGISEKPSLNFLVNAGVYVLSPHVVATVKPNEPLDMPNVFSKLVEEKRRAGVFTVQDYWTDIGRIDDLNLAVSDYHRVFGDRKSPASA